MKHRRREHYTLSQKLEHSPFAPLLALDAFCFTKREVKKRNYSIVPNFDVSQICSKSSYILSFDVSPIASQI